MDASALGIGAFVTASLVVGVRLLRLASRTRRSPELAIGLCCLLGGLGYLAGFGNAAGASLGPFSARLGAASIALVDLAAISLLFFTWRVFRPEPAGFEVIPVAGGAVLAVSFVGQAITGDFAENAFHGPFFWCGYGVRGGAFGWAALESLLYHRRMLRRLALGIGDRLVANTFALWGAGSGAIFVSYAIWGGATVTNGNAYAGPAALANAALGVLAAAAIWLAFFPPAVSRRRVRGGGAAPAS